jgi:D-glycero-alpha-D-manno-heptose-7-phosphate kinase
MVKVTAPVRIDISAGWSDASPFVNDFGGAVLNAAINHRVSATLRHGKLVSSLNHTPGHSGLGTSGALRTVYLVAANPKLIEDKIDLIKRVHTFENAIVGQRAGYQDQAAAVFGGVNYWEFSRNGAIRKTPLSKRQVRHLQDRLVLVFTGEGHISASVHEKVFEGRRFIKYIPQIDRMRIIARTMMQHVSNEKVMAELIRETWELQKVLHENMETPAMRKIQNVCKDCYLAARATGAGGGGCMLFYVKPKCKPMLVRKIGELGKKLSNVKIIPFKFDYKGIELTRR